MREALEESLEKRMCVCVRDLWRRSGYYIFWCSMCQKTKIPLFSCFHFKATFGPFLTTISLLICMIKSTSAYGVKIKAKIKFMNKTKLLFLDDIDLRLEMYCLR